jgi:Kef-type K+ transport system membrane component KefB
MVGISYMIQSSPSESALLILVLEIGLVIIFSIVTARVLGKRGIPNVLGLILAGVLIRLISDSTGFPTPPTSDMHFIITTGALGFIGYNIGAHLDIKKLRNESWKLSLLLVGEAVGAFIIVTFMIGLLFNEWILALLLGSIAMATAPASTSEIIREYNAQGPLSQTILFIIAFDDILAIIFFNLVLNYSESQLIASSMHILEIVFPIIIEIGGSLLIGTVIALLLTPFHIDEISASQSAEVVFPAVLICIAVAGLLDMSVILACITLGIVLSNFARCQSKDCIMGVDRLSKPLIALFFILVGFEMELAELFNGAFFIIIVYIIARTLGKFFGSYSTARIAGMPKAVAENIPFSILTQAGVALGLAALAYSRLYGLTPEASTIAILLLDIVTISVLIAEIIGPFMLKFGLNRAKEINNQKAIAIDQSCED